MTRRLIAALVLALAPVPAHAVADPAQSRFAAAAEAAKAAMLEDPRQAIERAHAAGALAAALPEGQERRAAQATLLWLEAEARYRLDDLNAASPLITRALTLARTSKPGSLLEADILLTHGSISGKKLDVAEALVDFQRAHRLFRRRGDARHEAIALICLATLYLDAKDDGTALRYLQEALDAYQADPGLALAIHNDRGIAFQDQGLFRQANKEFEAALVKAREVGGATNEGKVWRNIARNALYAGQTGLADRAVAAARGLPKSSTDDTTQLDAVAAQAALQHGRAREAGQLIDRAFAGVDLTTTDISLREAHRTAIAAYRVLDRPEQALAHLVALKRLDDEATKLATQTSTALLAARFDSVNQDAKIARLKLEDDLQRARAERTMLLGAAGATAMVIVLLLIGFFAIRRSRDQVRAANGDLAVTNAALGKALAAKTEFLATTSHEIRTPLNGILGMTQVMLADRELALAQRERLSVVHGAGLTMKALVDDILDVAKMETGNLTLDRAPFDLAACLQGAAALWADQAQAKGLAFAVELTDCPRWVEGDAARVRQVAFNLLSNALKFTPSGKVTLRAEATATGARITVADTGIGIAADQQRAVFEAFRQADASTTRQFGGTGLGLSICRNLVVAMGGELTLDSRPGRGSTFAVALPLASVAAPVSVASELAGEEGAVLVIDRNPITRAMFRSLLAPHAARVLLAGGLDDALSQLAAGGIDRVLIDDGTARADGDAHAFVARIVAGAGAAETTLLWPAGADGERRALLALGLTRVVAKPIGGGALTAMLFARQDDEPNGAQLVSRAA